MSVVDDFANTELNMLYKGRYPQNKDEIAISKDVGKLYGKSIGDRITLNHNNKVAEYTITGFVQSMQQVRLICLNNDGSTRLITEEIIATNMGIYFNNPKDTVEFINKLKTTYGDSIYPKYGKTGFVYKTIINLVSNTKKNFENILIIVDR